MEGEIGMAAITDTIVIEKIKQAARILSSTQYTSEELFIYGWLKVHKSFQLIDDTRNPAGFIYKTAYHGIQDFLKREKYVVSLQDYYPNQEYSNMISNIEAEKKLKFLLTNTTSFDRIVIKMLIQGNSILEIANHLKMHPATLSVRLKKRRGGRWKKIMEYYDQH